MAALAAVAAVISYGDGLFLVRRAGATGHIVYLYPLLPDGLIVICLISLYDAARMHAPRPAWATAGVIIGAALTVAMNLAAGLAHSHALALIDALVPVMFFVAVEVFIGHVRRGRGALSPSIPGVPPATLPACGHVVGDPADAVRVAVEHARECLDQKVIIRELARQTGIDHRKLSKLAAPATEDSPAGVALAPVSAQPPPPGGAPAGATMNAQPPRRGWASTPPPPAVPATQSPNGQHAEGR